jgi:hypothetical protein
LFLSQNEDKAMDLSSIRADIEQRRYQISRQRKEILDLQRAGISTKSAEELLARMLAKVDELCAVRDRLVGESRRKYDGKNKFILGPQIRIGKKRA